MLAERSWSASSMQSPPASADRTRVMAFIPTLAAPGDVAQVDIGIEQVPQAQVLGQGGRQ